MKAEFIDISPYYLKMQHSARIKRHIIKALIKDNIHRCIGFKVVIINKNIRLEHK